MQLSAFSEWGGIALDSARMYVRGETEAVLGGILGDQPWEVTTKPIRLRATGKILRLRALKGSWRHL